MAADLELADSLAHLMTTAKQIAGNPRLIKRFLNTLQIRYDMARLLGVYVDRAALAKLLLFERCGDASAYARLVREVNDHEEGKPVFLKDWEAAVKTGRDAELKEMLKNEPGWGSEFVNGWLALQPAFSDLDLRPAVYVSREQLQLVTSNDALSSAAAAVLNAILQLKSDKSKTIASQVRALPGREISMIMDQLLPRARQEQNWGKPAILFQCLTVIEADPAQGERLAIVLKEIPGTQIRPSLIPLLENESWARELFRRWENDPDVSSQVKKAIRSPVTTP